MRAPDYERGVKRRLLISLDAGRLGRRPDDTTAGRVHYARTNGGSWGPFAFGFCFYIALFIAGFYLELPVLNVVGAVGMIFIASIGNYRRMFTFRSEAPVRIALVNIVTLSLTLASSTDASGIAIILKYAFTFLVFVQVYSWRLPPLNQCAWRWKLFVATLALILFSFATGNHFVMEEERRLSGIFANPNNLALIGIALLFFVNEKDRTILQAGVHLLVVATLAVTNTSGAILSYAIGMAYRFRSNLARWQWIGAVVLVLGAGVVLDLNGLVVHDRVARQMQVIQENLGAALNAEDVGYGDLARQYGASSLSGLWRLEMWTRVVSSYVHGDAKTWLLGRGAGTSRADFGNLPHNDYLRLLSETGAFGLLAYLAFFAIVWRWMRSEDRYLLLVFLAYSVTENNIDNFLFMALLMFFLGSSIQVRSGRPVASSRRTAPRVPFTGEGTPSWNPGNHGGLRG